MAIYVYDGSFAGLLSVVFSAFQLKETPGQITIEQQLQLGLLEPVRTIATDMQMAERVLTGIDNRIGARASTLIYKMFLSEISGVENTIFELIKKIVSYNHPSILQNFADEHVLNAMQIDKMINREVHRMHAFVRFQQTTENLYCAAVDPDFNVLPLIGEHFAKRYVDQRWIIMDTRRRRALFYNLQTVVFTVPGEPVFDLAEIVLKGGEGAVENHYQSLWKQYFQAVNIEQRRNTRLHSRHMPKRYWKYLIEKEPA